MTPSYLRIGGLAYDLPEGFEEKAMEFVKAFPAKVAEYETLLTKNRIWIRRTKDVGVLSKEDAISLGVSGPVIRGSDVYWDIRKDLPYSGYKDFDFVVPTGKNGDCYDRYIIRMEEMRQSAGIVRQALENLPQGEINVYDPKVVLPPKDDVYNNISDLIHHFKVVSEGFTPPVGEVYFSIESPKGELGFYIVSDGTNKPYRLRIRPPSFINLEALPKMVEGRLIADVIAVIGSIDIVLGEVDR